MSNARLVRVLVAAVYNDPDHRALPFADVGDDIIIADGDYADWLREQGMVVFVNTSDERAALEREIADLKEHMDLLELEKQVATEVKEEIKEEDGEGDDDEEVEEAADVDEGKEPVTSVDPVKPKPQTGRQGTKRK